MSIYTIQDTTLTDIADAIRSKTGKTASMTPAEMVDEIESIGGGFSTLIIKNITTNGTYNASDDNADGYSSVTVNVPSSQREIVVPEQTIEVSSNYTQLNYVSPLVEGEEYIYTINGSVYSGTAVYLYGSVAIGTNSIGRIEYQNGMYFGIENTSLEHGTYTVKVEKETGGSSSPTLVTKEITSNGTYSASDDSADGYSSVTVNVNHTDSIVVKSRDSDGYPTELDYYNSDGIVPALTFCNTRSIAASGWCYGRVTKINLKGSNSFRVYGEAFRGMHALTDPDFSKITELVNNGSNNTGNQATFRTCAGLLTVNAPNLTGGLPVYCFFDCKKLVSVYLPKINAINGYSSNRGSFGNCSALTTCEFGSVGYPITFVQNYAFHSCTAIETMTFYAKGDYVDELLANVRNCVTTGTIIVKASEATTYGGTSYAAGDTIVTSTP